MLDQISTISNTFVILFHKHIYAWFFFHAYFQVSLFLFSISEIYFLLSLPGYGVAILVQNFHWSRYESTDLSFSCLYSAFSIEKVYLTFLKISLLQLYLKQHGFRLLLLPLAASLDPAAVPLPHQPLSLLPAQWNSHYHAFMLLPSYFSYVLTASIPPEVM